LTDFNLFQHINGINPAIARRTLGGSIIGGIAETQEVVDYCAARGIKAQVQTFDPTRSITHSPVPSTRPFAIATSSIFLPIGANP
jgi:hypothetical protein